MAVVIGHSQTKYLSEYLPKDSYSVFAYPGYRIRQFLTEDVLYDVVPYFSVVVIMVGVNDITSKSPEAVVNDIASLCYTIRQASPSCTVVISEVLPRAQNLIPGSQLRLNYIERWNEEAGIVNYNIHELSKKVSWIQVIQHTDFFTLFGAKRNLLSKDGLHLSYDGTQTLTSSIEAAVRRHTPTPTPTRPSPVQAPIRPTPVSIRPSPVQAPIRPTPVYIRPTPVYIRPSPVEAPIRPSPVQAPIRPTPVYIRPTPVYIRPSPVEAPIRPSTVQASIRPTPVPSRHLPEYMAFTQTYSSHIRINTILHEHGMALARMNLSIAEIHLFLRSLLRSTFDRVWIRSLFPSRHKSESGFELHTT